MCALSRIVSQPNLDFESFLKTPSCKEILSQFIKYNHLSKPKKITNTSNGVIVYWRDNSLINLYFKIEEDLFGVPRPNIGGDGMSSSQTTKYNLEGTLRKDDSNYWFIAPSKASKKR